MRGHIASALALGAVLSLGACAPEGPLPTFPFAPALAWQVTATELGEGLGLAEPTLVDPAVEASGEGLSSPVAYEVGGRWITAVRDRADLDAPSALFGLDPATGDVAWTYRPTGEAVIRRCSPQLLDDAMTCLLGGPDLWTRAEGASSVAFLDPASGEEVRRLPLAGTVWGVTVDDDRLLVLRSADDLLLLRSVVEVASVASLTPTGAAVWTTEVVLTPDEADVLYFAELAAGPPVAMAVGGRLVLFDRATGDVLVDEAGVRAEFPAAGGVVLVPSFSSTGAPPRLLDERGTELGSYPGHDEITGYAAEPGPVLLRSPVGEVVALDGRSARARSTGVVLADDLVNRAEVAHGVLVVQSGDDAWYVHALTAPGTVLAELGGVWSPPVADGAVLYTVTAGGPEVTLSATSLDDGATLWELPLVLPRATSTESLDHSPRLDLLGDRLALTDWASVAALGRPAGGTVRAPTPGPGTSPAGPVDDDGDRDGGRHPGAVVGWGDDEGGATVAPRAVEPARAISAGGYHSLALREDGTVGAWGWNDSRQSSVPVGLDRVTQISAGGHLSIALTADGGAVTWGYPEYEQHDRYAGRRDLVAVAAGGEHALVLTAGGEVEAWGDDRFGQTQVPTDLEDVVAIDTGHFHNLALRRDGTIAAWGFNGSNRATVPEGLSDVVAISAGRYHNLALRSDGTVLAWGNDRHGRASVPAGLRDVVALAAGDSHSLALRRDGTVVAWGDDGYGQSSVPDGLDDVVAVAAGAYHSLALRQDGSIVAWGRDLEHQVPAPQELTAVTAVSAGPGVSIALRRDGTISAWGEGGATEVPARLPGVTAVSAGGGYGLALSRDGDVVAWGSSPDAVGTVPTRGGLIAIDAGPDHALAVTSGGTVEAWGRDGTGQVDVPDDLSDVVAVSAGGTHSLALRADGSVRAWGSDRSGQCDPPAGLSHVVAVAAGGSHSLALRDDGTVVAWGANVAGATDVPAGLAGVVAVDAGAAHSVALRRDGTVVAWGSDLEGQSSVPADLPPVAAIAAGAHHTLALLGSP